MESAGVPGEERELSEDDPSQAKLLGAFASVYVV